MSSLDERASLTLKKRKLQRACDYCRSKKVKCDGPKMLNKRCSNCTARRAECTYVLGYNSGYPRSHVEALESRLKRMEHLLCPGADVSKGLDSPQSDNELTFTIPPFHTQSRAGASRAECPATPPKITMAPPAPGLVDNSSRGDEEEADLDKELTEGMRKLSMQSQPLRYHGKSSALVFIRSTMALKHEYAGLRRTAKSDPHHPWLKAFEEDDFPVFDESRFPPPDLLDVLVDLYFYHIGCHYPLLHEPTVKNSIQAGLHLHHGPFGATVLLVCAIGSRFTSDPRVLLDGSGHPHSAGWKWFALVEGVRRLSFAPAKLHNLQVYALMAIYLQGSTTPQAAWTVIGAGIRAAVDIGAHRRKMYASTPTVEEELWRRAFWVLVLLEWTLAYNLGRPSAIHDEDIDLALPTECDDEYWLTREGEPLFKQPPNKPSKVTAFVCTIRLGRILALVMRTIYSSSKSKAHLSQSNQQWEQHVVELGSGLNQWATSLPSHLRWDPEQENVVFLTQAATLIAFYNFCQMAVHRDFLSSLSPGREQSAPSLPSGIICTNAARSTVQVLEVLYNRTGSPNHKNMGILFLAGMVLVTNAFGLKRSARKVNVEKDLELASKAVGMLRSLQYEAHVSESVAELLNDLIYTINEPLPPGACTSGTAQWTSTEKTEAGRPRSPIALSPERPLRKEHTEARNTHWLPTFGDMNNTHTGSSFAPFTSAYPSATIHIPPILDYLQPDTPPSTPPFASDSLAPHAQSYIAPFDNSQSCDAQNHVPPPSAPYKYNSPTPYDSGELQPRNDAPAVPHQGIPGQYQLDMADRHMYGQEALLWNCVPSSSSGPSDPQVGVTNYARTSYRLADMAMGERGDRTDVATSDFGLMMNDALVMWPNLPPASGWADWGAHTSGANDWGESY